MLRAVTEGSMVASVLTCSRNYRVRNELLQELACRGVGGLARRVKLAVAILEALGGVCDPKVDCCGLARTGNKLQSKV
jgi:hypothetical protein